MPDQKKQKSDRTNLQSHVQRRQFLVAGGQALAGTNLASDPYSTFNANIFAVIIRSSKKAVCTIPT